MNIEDDALVPPSVSEYSFVYGHARILTYLLLSMKRRALVINLCTQMGLESKSYAILL